MTAAMTATIPIQPGPTTLVGGVGPGKKRVQEDLHQRDEAGELRAGCDPGRHRRVPPRKHRRPLVKRHRGDLEPESHHQQEDRDGPGHVPREARRAPGVLSSFWIASRCVVPVMP